MLLAVDVGNTQTVFGLYDGPERGERWRIATEAHRTGDELGALLADFRDLGAIDGICLSCTVPRLVPEYEHVAERWAKAELLVVGPGVRTGIPVEHDAPRDVGPDRIVNAVAAKELFGAPAIVADFGTSTNFDVVSPAGAYVGGVLAPGIEVSMDALFARAAGDRPERAARHRGALDHLQSLPEPDGADENQQRSEEAPRDGQRLPAAVDRDREPIEEHLVPGRGQLHLEPLDERRRAGG